MATLTDLAVTTRGERRRGRDRAPGRRERRRWAAVIEGLIGPGARHQAFPLHLLRVGPANRAAAAGPLAAVAAFLRDETVDLDRRQLSLVVVFLTSAASPLYDRRYPVRAAWAADAVAAQLGARSDDRCFGAQRAGRPERLRKT